MKNNGEIMSKSALIVDDERTQRRLVAAILEERLELTTIEASNGLEALEILRGERKDDIVLVSLDLDMPKMTGLEALPEILRISPDLPVIVVTGTADIESAAQAMKLGAADFFSKPVKADRITASAKNALKIALLSREVHRLQRQSGAISGFSDLIGADGGLSAVIYMAQKAAASDIPVLVHGETGVGKEMLARAIHGESTRAASPFIAVNCGAIPEKLVESTLFGHEKGSFTGAIKTTLGKFREAEGGTIFLDEVGELPPEAQVKMLRVLQEHEIEPVGTGRAVPIDVRVISATNRDLERDVQAGRFREDLYFRLNVLPLGLPPLRDRPQDIPALVQYFTHKFLARNTQNTPNDMKEISADALRALQAYPWSGNVRELENTINRSLILSDHQILGAGDIAFANTGLAPNTQTVSSSSSVWGGASIPIMDDDGELRSLKDIELLFFKAALAECGNSVAKAARKIGIAKSTLYRKLDAA